jgi:predicted alpha/beta superfamily hydrolase
MFGTVVDATRIMSMSGEAPEAIVVGLSFSDRSMSEYLRQRARWYTPSPWVPPAITGVKGVEAHECGRADELMAFIGDRVLPAVESGHIGDLQVSRRWLIGHSFSALFALRTLLKNHTMFDKWLLASPSIWWDDRSILKLEAERAAAKSDLVARVFTCYGQLEARPLDAAPGPPMVGGESIPDFRMGANVEDLVATLRARNYRGLELSHAVIEGDDHASSIGAAVSKGLRALL